MSTELLKCIWFFVWKIKDNNLDIVFWYFGKISFECRSVSHLIEIKIRIKNTSKQLVCGSANTENKFETNRYLRGLAQ